MWSFGVSALKICAYENLEILKATTLYTHILVLFLILRMFLLICMQKIYFNQLISKITIWKILSSAEWHNLSHMLKPLVILCNIWCCQQMLIVQSYMHLYVDCDSLYLQISSPMSVILFYFLDLPWNTIFFICLFQLELIGKSNSLKMAEI